MNTLLRFHFIAVDGMDTNVDTFVKVRNLEPGMYKEIDDAISSYIDEVEDWQYDDVINDVLASFGLDYEFVNPHTFYI